MRLVVVTLHLRTLALVTNQLLVALADFSGKFCLVLCVAYRKFSDSTVSVKTWRRVYLFVLPNHNETSIFEQFVEDKNALLASVSTSDHIPWRRIHVDSLAVDLRKLVWCELNVRRSTWVKIITTC